MTNRGNVPGANGRRNGRGLVRQLDVGNRLLNNGMLPLPLRVFVAVIIITAIG